MEALISPARSLKGSVRLPGDKSISHRYALLGGIAEGATRIRDYSTGADCQSTLECLAELGVEVRRDGTNVGIRGLGLDSLCAPTGPLNAGNSGSTIRMLSGILAAQPFASTVRGDSSLARRPMERIIKPLTLMGAKIRAREDRYPPLEIHGRPLEAIRYELPVASAQVKSCVLFAGLFADGITTAVEPLRTRDHTELALREFGAEVEVTNGEVSVHGQPQLRGRELTVPGDISSAAFFLVAAMLLPGSELTIENVGLNPTRAALLDFLKSMGAAIQVTNLVQRHGEPVGDLAVTGGPVRGGTIEGGLTAALIDEVPVLAVLGAVSEEGLTVRNAAELRVKETDRIASVADNLERMGITIEVAEDGFRVPGGQRFRAAELDSLGDHRIAMAFGVAALAADGDCRIANSEAASVSYPEFFDTLHVISE